MSTTADANFYARLSSLITASQPLASTPESVLAQLGTPSASIAILDAGTITTHMISNIPTHNTDTLFQACSISKPCAGLGLARLIEKGLFKLDDRMVDLLPADVVDNMTVDPRTKAMAEQITVKMLMSHTAGLSVGGFPGYPIEVYAVDEVPSVKKLLTGGVGVNTARVKVIAPPGMDFMYSGGGIMVLQCIVEHVTGKPFDEVIKAEVLEPLGMERSFYRLPSGEDNIAHAYHTGYTKCEARWHTLPEHAAGGLWSTPGDLLKMVRALQGILEQDTGPKTNKEAGLISREMAQTLVTRVKANMGLTWFCDGVSMGHGGSNNPGYRCMMYGYADLPWNDENPGKKGGAEEKSSNFETIRIPKGCGISIMTNAATGSEVVWKLIRAITYLKGWPSSAHNYYSPMEAGAPLAINNSVDSGAAAGGGGGAGKGWKEWIGRWTDKNGKYLWTIEQDEEGKPVARTVSHGVEVTGHLKTAAIPPARYAAGRGTSFDLLIDGTEIMLRFGWEHETVKGQEVKKTVEMYHYADLALKIVVLYPRAS